MGRTTDAGDRVAAGYREAVTRFGKALEASVPVSAAIYSIGSLRVRVRVVGPTLFEAMHASWSHLLLPAVAGGAEDLRIDLWHRAETGIDPPAEIEEIDVRERFPYRVSRGDRIAAMRQPCTAAWLDRTTGHLVGAVTNADDRTHYEAGRPLETLLLVRLRDQGVSLVHASFVARGDRGALIVGQSGSGKSTLAAECLCSGFGFLGDDKIAFVRAGRHFAGHSLGSSLHVDEASLARLPQLSPAALAPVSELDDKHRVPLERVFAERLRASAPISLLVIPRRSPDSTDTRAEPAAKRDALLALSLSTLLHLPIARRQSLEHLAELVNAAPAVELPVGPPGAPQRLAEVLDSV